MHYEGYLLADFTQNRPSSLPSILTIAGLPLYTVFHAHVWLLSLVLVPSQTDSDVRGNPWKQRSHPQEKTCSQIRHHDPDLRSEKEKKELGFQRDSEVNDQAKEKEKHYKQRQVRQNTKFSLIGRRLIYLVELGSPYHVCIMIHRTCGKITIVF